MKRQCLLKTRPYDTPFTVSAEKTMSLGWNQHDACDFEYRKRCELVRIRIHHLDVLDRADGLHVTYARSDNDLSYRLACPLGSMGSLKHSEIVETP